jgi:hypothetical protein
VLGRAPTASTAMIASEGRRPTASTKMRSPGT